MRALCAEQWRYVTDKVITIEQAYVVIVQCLRGVLCAWRVREVSLQIIHKGPLGTHNNQGGRLVPRQ